MNARNGQLSPSLVNSDQFVRILKNIRNSLASETYLPFKIRDIGKFYDLPVILTRNKGSTLTIVMDIPLKSTSNQYDVFRSYQVPATSDDVKYTFDLDSDSLIAISTDQNSYIPITKQEFVLCQTSICKLNRVKYARPFGKHCVFLLFSKHYDEILNYCTLKSSHITTNLKATWLKSNSWIIESGKDLTIDIVCKRDKQLSRMQHTISKSIELIDLESGCYIESHKFNTPRFINNYLGTNVINRINFDENFTDLFFKEIVNKKHQLLVPVPNIEITTLPPVSHIAQGDIPYMHDDYISLGEHKSWVPSAITGIVCVILVCTTTLICACYLRRQYHGMLNKRHSPAITMKCEPNNEFHYVTNNDLPINDTRGDLDEPITVHFVENQK